MILELSCNVMCNCFKNHIMSIETKKKKEAAELFAGDEKIDRDIRYLFFGDDDLV